MNCVLIEAMLVAYVVTGAANHIGPPSLALVAVLAVCWLALRPS